MACIPSFGIMPVDSLLLGAQNKVSALPFPSWVTQGKSLCLSGPVSLAKMETDNSLYIRGGLWEANSY